MTGTLLWLYQGPSSISTLAALQISSQSQLTLLLLSLCETVQLLLTTLEDILRRHRGVGQHGGCIGVIDGVSLLVLDLWVFFKDHQLIFGASSLPHGHLGRQAADREGELGLLEEAGPVKGAVC